MIIVNMSRNLIFLDSKVEQLESLKPKSKRNKKNTEHHNCTMCVENRLILFFHPFYIYVQLVHVVHHLCI